MVLRSTENENLTPQYQFKGLRTAVSGNSLCSKGVISLFINHRVFNSNANEYSNIQFLLTNILCNNGNPMQFSVKTSL